MSRFGLLGLHPAVLLLHPEVLDRVRYISGTTDFGESLVQLDQLLRGFDLAGVLLACVADSFHGGVPGPVLPDQDSY